MGAPDNANSHIGENVTRARFLAQDRKHPTQRSQHHSALADGEWSVISPLLPQSNRANAIDLRVVLDALIRERFEKTRWSHLGDAAHRIRKAIQETSARRVWEQLAAALPTLEGLTERRRRQLASICSECAELGERLRKRRRND